MVPGFQAGFIFTKFRSGIVIPMLKKWCYLNKYQSETKETFELAINFGAGLEIPLGNVEVFVDAIATHFRKIDIISRGNNSSI